jgi:IS30 family transposase
VSYTQLTREQRYQIKALLDTGHSRTEIAQQLEVNKSTVSREVRRNRGRRGYRPKQAHEMALKRRKEKAQTKIGPETWGLVEAKLLEDWSPEQISGRLKTEGIAISHEHIYQYIYADKRAGGTLWTHVCTQRLSDSEGLCRTLGAKDVPLLAEPGGACFCGVNRTCHNPLSARQFEALRNNLLAGTFNRAAADHIASSSEAVITHAFHVVGEIGYGL